MTEEPEEVIGYTQEDVRQEFEKYLQTLNGHLAAEALDPSADPRTIKVHKDFLDDESEWLMSHPEATLARIAEELQESHIFQSLHGPHGPQGAGRSRIAKIVVAALRLLQVLVLLINASWAPNLLAFKV